MEIFRALAVLAEPPDRAEAARVADALGLGAPPGASEYTELFVFQLYPYASVYLGAEGMLGGEARDRVAGFLSALSLKPPPEPDHLTTLLATYAQLAERAADDGGAGGGDAAGARREGWRAARRAFLWEHLLSWLPAYLDRVSDIAPPFYRRWAELLAHALAGEAAAVGRQPHLPLHLRAAPPAADPRAEGADRFLRSLLAPARGGMILVRADLARAARELNLGLRAGERRFALQTLMSQDAAGTLGWLAREASARAARHLRHRAAFGDVSEWWARRAEAAAILLRELQTEAESEGMKAGV
jgi:TorA maturation chaperone TorD